MSISITARCASISLGAALLLGGVAWAASPHFIKSTGSIDTTTGDYTATWKEAGLGNTPINYELASTNSSSFWQCFTKSGNQPQGSPQAGGAGLIVQTGTFTPHNGSITGSLSLSPEVGTAHCQGGGLVLCLASVSYAGVSITDTTNGIVENLPDAAATFPGPTGKNSRGCISPE